MNPSENYAWHLEKGYRRKNFGIYAIGLLAVGAGLAYLGSQYPFPPDAAYQDNILMLAQMAGKDLAAFPANFGVSLAHLIHALTSSVPPDVAAVSPLTQPQFIAEQFLGHTTLQDALGPVWDGRFNAEAVKTLAGIALHTLFARRFLFTGPRNRANKDVVELGQFIEGLALVNEGEENKTKVDKDNLVEQLATINKRIHNLEIHQEVDPNLRNEQDGTMRKKLKKIKRKVRRLELIVKDINELGQRVDDSEARITDLDTELSDRCDTLAERMYILEKYIENTPKPE